MAGFLSSSAGLLEVVDNMVPVEDSETPATPSEDSAENKAVRFIYSFIFCIHVLVALLLVILTDTKFMFKFIQIK